MMTTKCSLVVDVVHARGRRVPMTIGLVKFGPVLLASTVKPLTGRYTGEQVLDRLRSHPADFRVTVPGAEVLPRLLG